VAAHLVAPGRDVAPLAALGQVSAGDHAPRDGGKRREALVDHVYALVFGGQLFEAAQALASWHHEFGSATIGEVVLDFVELLCALLCLLRSD